MGVISMKNYIKNIVAFIISFILMAVLLMTSLTMFFRGTILNSQTYIGVLEKHNIYNQIYDNIYSNIHYLLLSNNIEENTLDGVISIDEVSEVVNDYIYYTIGYMKNEAMDIPKIDMSVYENRLESIINKFLSENSMYLNEELKDNIGELEGTVLDIIKSDLEIINLNELSKSKGMNMIAKVSAIINSGPVIMGLLVLVIILIGMISLIWKKRKARKFAWIGYSFISCGLIVFLIGFSGYISGFYNHVAIAIPYLAMAMTFIIKEYLLKFTIIGCLILFIGICFMSIYWRYLYKKYSCVYKDMS